MTGVTASRNYKYAVFAILGMAGIVWANYVQHILLPEPEWDHDVKLMSFSGRWVYLTVHVLFIQLVYFCLATIVEILHVCGRPIRFLTQLVYSTCTFVGGLGFVVASLFWFFYALQFWNPAWRGQWDYYEEKGFPFETWMHIIHNPPWILPLMDAMTKDHRLLKEHKPSFPTIILWTCGYVLFYAVWTLLNFYFNGGHWPYPWFYDMNSVAEHVVFYVFMGFVVSFMITGPYHLMVVSKRIKADVTRDKKAI